MRFLGLSQSLLVLYVGSYPTEVALRRKHSILTLHFSKLTHRLEHGR